MANKTDDVDTSKTEKKVQEKKDTKPKEVKEVKEEVKAEKEVKKEEKVETPVKEVTTKEEVKEETKKEVKEETKKEVVTNNVAPTPVPVPQKKSKAPMIIAIVVGSILLLGGIAFGIYALVSNSDLFGSLGGKTTEKDDSSDKKSSSKDKDTSKDKDKDKDKDTDTDSDKDSDKDKDKDTDKDSDKDTSKDKNKDKDKDTDKDKDNKKTVDVSTIKTTYSDGSMIVYGNYKDKDGFAVYGSFLVDKDLKVISTADSYDSSSNWTDGYKLEGSTNKGYTLIDVSGKTIWSCKENEYYDVDLLSNGHLYITKKTDTYNSSKIEAGVYNAKSKKMVLEMNESNYNQKWRDFGNGLLINYDREAIFNTKIDKYFKVDWISYSSNFENGYLLKQESINGYGSDATFKITITKDDGTVVVNTLPKGVHLTSYIIGDNGKSFGYETGSDGGQYILDLATGNVLDLGHEYHDIINGPKFTKNGYGLLVFSNSGGVKYYTVLDSTGKKIFEPVRINDDIATVKMEKYTMNDDGYFMVKTEGVNVVMDFKNQIALKPQDGETFVELVGSYVKVTNSTGESYYKNMKGKKLTIEV